MINESLITLHYAQMAQEIEDDQAKISTEDFDLVVDCTHYSGKTKLPRDIENKLWAMADGFGECDIDYIANTLEWDWSHIRDSSSAAVVKMANFLREKGFTL